MNPCQSCSSHKALYSVVEFQYNTQALYPIAYITNVTAEAKELRLFVNMSKVGIISCAAFTENSTLASAYTVKLQGASTPVTDIDNLAEVHLKGLSPETSYDVYCYAEDFQGHYADLEAVKATKVVTSTACCRAVEFVKYWSQIVEYKYKASGTANDAIYQLALNAQPTVSTTVTLSMATKSTTSRCTYAETGITSEATVYPSTITFEPSSTSLLGNFIIRGTPGCYTLQAATNNVSTFSNASLAVNIRNSSTMPTPPTVSSVILSNDGLKLTATFDSSTDKGVTAISGYDSVYTCSNLFSFTGDSSADCVWQTSSVVIHNHSAWQQGEDRRLPVGSCVQLFLSAVCNCYCPYCSHYSHSEFAYVRFH
jgi:hypothetical protein